MCVYICIVIEHSRLENIARKEGRIRITPSTKTIFAFDRILWCLFLLQKIGPRGCVMIDAARVDDPAREDVSSRWRALAQLKPRHHPAQRKTYDGQSYASSHSSTVPTAPFRSTKRALFTC